MSAANKPQDFSQLSVFYAYEEYKTEPDCQRDSWIFPDGSILGLNYWEHSPVGEEIIKELEISRYRPEDVEKWGDRVWKYAGKQNVESVLTRWGCVHNGSRWSHMAEAYSEEVAIWGYTEPQKRALEWIAKNASHDNASSTRRVIRSFLAGGELLPWDGPDNSPLALEARGVKLSFVDKYPGRECSSYNSDYSD